MYFRREGCILERGGTGRGTPLNGKGVDSPGALDTEVRCQFHFQPRSLTWREPVRG